MALEVGLSSAVAGALRSSQNIAALQARTQLRLATGRRFNSLLENPQAVSVSRSLSNRASDFLSVKNNIGQGISKASTAIKGLDSIAQTLQQLKAIAVQHAGSNSPTEQAALGVLLAVERGEDEDHRRGARQHHAHHHHRPHEKRGDERAGNGARLRDTHIHSAHARGPPEKVDPRKGDDAEKARENDAAVAADRRFDGVIQHQVLCGLAHHTLVSEVDLRELAVALLKADLDLAGCLCTRAADFRDLVLEPLRHVDSGTMNISRDRIANRFRCRLEDIRDDNSAHAVLHVDFEVDGLR